MKEVETQTHTKVTETSGVYPPVPQITPVTNVSVTPTQPETVGQKLAGQVATAMGVASVTFLTAQNPQHYLTGVLVVAAIVLPLEVTRRVLAIMQTRTGTTTAMAAAGAAVASAGRAHSAILTVFALSVGLTTAVTGCPAWNRPTCPTPGRYQCEANQPHYCGTSRQLTPIGDQPCASGESCQFTSDGIAFCGVSQ